MQLTPLMYFIVCPMLFVAGFRRQPKSFRLSPVNSKVRCARRVGKIKGAALRMESCRESDKEKAASWQALLLERGVGRDYLA